MKKIELWDDVLAEEPEYNNTEEYEKAHKKWQKRLDNSIGHINFLHEAKVFIEDRKGKQPKICSSPYDPEIVFDVRTSRGTFLTCRDQESATILSTLTQVNERLKRIEQKLGGKDGKV